uniref:E3 ubiquitin-protein ligase TRIM38-like n=2 Tax=Xiphophorus maculatus TaxID=8083 RepID=A0A3B5QAF9_XIPMA
MNKKSFRHETFQRTSRSADMASTCSILYEEQVLCSICLGEFNELVSTPCGHNLCKACITQSWNKKSVGQIEETLRNEMEMLIQKLRSSDSCEAPTQSHAVENMTDNNFLPELWSQPQDELMKIQQSNAVDLTLDPYTASNWLKVSDDGKRLTFRGRQQIFSSFFGRPFKYLPYILAKEGFSSGRFYYEVQVGSCNRWLLGVVKEFINREIYSIPTPEDGAWILNTPSNMFLNQIQTVGVFVDYEEGKVSFHDVEARSEICTITGGSFKETTSLRSFLSSVAGISSIHRPKIYPVFGIYNYYYGASLVITSVCKP